MITIEYTEYGESVSDFGADFWFKLVMEHKDFDATYKVSTALPIDLIRLAIVKGELKADEVTFIFNGKIIPCNEYGAIQDWPTGFCNKNIDVCENIIRESMNKRRQEVLSNRIKS